MKASLDRFHLELNQLRVVITDITGHQGEYPPTNTQIANEETERRRALRSRSLRSSIRAGALQAHPGRFRLAARGEMTHSLQSGSLNVRSGSGEVEQIDAPMDRVHVGGHPPPPTKA